MCVCEEGRKGGFIAIAMSMSVCASVCVYGYGGSACVPSARLPVGGERL